MSWPPPPLPALATDRFALIVTALIGYVRTKIRAGVEWAVFDAAQARVRRIRNRFAALVVKYRAGTLPAPRPKRPAPVPPPASEPPDDSEPAEASEPKPKPVRPVSLLPRNFAWLCGIVPQWAAGVRGSGAASARRAGDAGADRRGAAGRAAAASAAVDDGAALPRFPRPATAGASAAARIGTNRPAAN